MSHQSLFPTFAAKNPRNSHAYDVYDVERLHDTIVGGSKQKE